MISKNRKKVGNPSIVSWVICVVALAVYLAIEFGVMPWALTVLAGLFNIHISFSQAFATWIFTRVMVWLWK